MAFRLVKDTGSSEEGENLPLRKKNKNVTSNVIILCPKQLELLKLPLPPRKKKGVGVAPIQNYNIGTSV
jgi:hypothetical protein